MKNRDDVLATIPVAVLLVLTAWGNAIAMAVASAIMLVVGLAVFRGRAFRGGLLVATVAAAIGIVMVLILHAVKLFRR